MPKAQFGRTPEAIDYLEEFLERGGTGFNIARRARPHPEGDWHIQPANRTWARAADGYGTRIVKMTPSYAEEVGTTAAARSFKGRIARRRCR